MSIDIQQREQRVPTNIITGFLGVGKTTAILHLLRRKPANERWAVLVNEFGEIGVDGSLFAGQREQGVFIREVPGGCMCCTAGLSMQIALNLLLAEAQPDRLLIEPTGLGHPIEVLQVLASEHYQRVLSIQKILTLVDARKLSNHRYTQHNTFNQQISIADVIVGNKSDLYCEVDRDTLVSYAQLHGSPHAQLLMTEQGILDPTWLEGMTSATATTAHSHRQHETPLSDTPIPESGFVKASNQGEGFYSVGWRFTPYHVFDRGKLCGFFQRLHVERMKGVFITDSGIFGYNLTCDGLTELPLRDCVESRIEMIAEEVDGGWERQLLDCVSVDF